MTNPFETLREEQTPLPAEKQSTGNIFGDVLLGAATGAAEGLDQTFDTASQLGGLAGEGIKAILPDDAERAVQRTLSPAANAFRRWGLVDDKGGSGLVELESGLEAFGVEAPETTSGQLANDLTQFVVVYAGAGKFVKGGGFKKTVAKGAAADFAAFDPHEERLSNLAEDYGIPFAEYLAADEEDGVIEGRIKQALEGAGLGLMFDAVIHGARGIRKGRRGDLEGAAEEARLADEALEVAAESEGVPGGTPQLTREVSEDGSETGTDLIVRDAPEDTSGAGSRRADEGTSNANTEDPSGRGIFVDDEAAGRFTSRLIERIKRTDAGEEILDDGYDALADLNLSKVSSARGVREATKALSEVFRSAHRSARGVDTLSLDEVAEQGQELAREILGSAQGKTFDNFESTLGRYVDDAQQLPFVIRALREINESAKGNTLRDLETLARDPSNANKQAALDSIAALVNAQTAVKGTTSNVARALRSLQDRVTENTDFSTMLRDIDDREILDALDPTGNSDNASDAFDALTRRAGKAKSGKALHSTVDPKGFLAGFRKAQRVTETMYTASILSGLGTHGVNVMGGMAQNVLQPLARSLGGLATADRALAQQGLDQLYQTFSATWEAMRIASRAWKTQRSVLESGASGSYLADASTSRINGEAILGEAGKGSLAYQVLNGLDYASQQVFRAMLFGDEMTRQMAFLGDIRARALREGREQGLEGADLSDFVDTRATNYVNENGSAVRVQDAFGNETNEFAAGAAVAQARSAVFMEGFERGTASYAMEKAIRALPFSRVVGFPFIRTPTNIIRTAVRRTPGLNLLLEDTRRALSGELGDEARKVAVGEMMVGSGLYAMGAMLAANGTITGSGPKDPNMRMALQATGWKPFAVKIGDDYFSFDRADPAAMFFATAASAYEAAAGGDIEGAEDIAGVAIGSFAGSVKDKTYLRGIADIVTLLEDGEESTVMRRFEKFGGKKVAGFIPSLVANAGRDANTDGVLKVTNGFLDEIKRRAEFVPGVGETLDRRYDPFFSTPVEAAQGFPLASVNLTSKGELADEVTVEVYRQLLASGSRSTAPTRKKDGIDLSQITATTGRTAHDRWQELTGTITVEGKTLRQAITDLVQSDEYKFLLTDGEGNGIRGSRHDEIAKLRTPYRAAAWKALIAETPELQEALAERDALEGRVDLRGSSPAPPSREEQDIDDFIATYRKN